MKSVLHNILILVVHVTTTCCKPATEFLIDDKKLVYFDRNLTWDEGSSLCRSLGSSLVAIKKVSFASRLTVALAASKAQSSVWIGGRLIHNSLDVANYKCLAINIPNIRFPTSVFNCSERKGVLCEKARLKPALLVEELSYNNHNYTVYEGQTAWQAAVAICNKRNMYLATLSDETELQEVTFILKSYVHLDIAAVWVGALNDYKSFNWITTGDSVEYVIHNNTAFSKCLTLNVKTQLFGAESCNNGHAFICESRYADDDYLESFVHKGNEYKVHSLRTTWEKASKICKADGSYLAMVEDMVSVHAVAVNMVGGWEALRTVWLGAKSVRAKSKIIYEWQNGKIPLSLKINRDGYPPWKNSTYRRHENTCLLLERTRTSLYFSDSACDNIHGFVCQRNLSVSPAVTFNFNLGDKHVIFHEKPETWLKAKEVCKLSYNKLLIVTDPDDLSSFKGIISRHQMWVDGIYEDKTWKWEQEIANSLTEEPIYGLHLNDDGSNSTTDTKCLAIQLQQKIKLKFVAHPCITKLSFLCEKNSQKEQIIKYKGNEYTVINKHMTWHEASAICQSRAQNLAVTCDINEAEFLSKLTIAYGDLWLGAIKREDMWLWDAVNVILPHKTHKNVGYPPWLNNRSNRKHMSCLTLTLNSLLHAAFTDTSCWEVKPFICQKNSKQHHKRKFFEPRVSVLNDRQYIFYPQLSTWKDANEECSDNLAFLAVVSTFEIAQHIANLTYGYSEIWIGGAIEDDVWKWAISGENIKSLGADEVQWTSENEIFDENVMNKAQFLALSRLNPKVPFFMEKGENEKLGFVCERANTINKDEYLTEQIQFESTRLLLVENKLNYTDASDFCEAKNGILVTANSRTILETLLKHTKKFHGVWLGAALTAQEQTFLWNHIRSEVVEEIYLTTGELLNAQHRTKRTAKDFDKYKSQLDDDILNYDDVSDKDYASFSAEDVDGDGILESWEINTKETIANGDEDELSKEESDRFKRAARYSKNASETLQKYTTTENLGIEDVSVSDNYALFKDDTMESSIKTSQLSESNISELSSAKLELLKSTKQHLMDIIKNDLTPNEEETAPTSVKDKTVEKIANKLLYNLVYCLKLNEDGKLVALNCSSRQSFVCEIRNDSKKRVKMYSIGNTTYAVSNERLSWQKAYNKCQKTFGGYLVIFKNIQEINFIFNSRDFQDLWVGAKYTNGWKWPYIHQSMYQNESLWSTNNRLHECANVYRQHSSNLVLVDRDCSKKHGFICKDVKQNIVDVDRIGNYTIHWKPAKVFDALNICSQENTVLITADSSKEILDVINLRRGLHSFWTSGLYLSGKWMWLNNNMAVQKSTIFNLSYTPGHKCLSIFKDSNTNYSLIDRNCNTYLPFVCANANNLTVVFNNISYTFYLAPLEWSKANAYCATKAQYMAIVNDRQSADFLQNVALVTGDLWVGAKLKNASKWIWDFTYESVDDNIHKLSKEINNASSDVCLYVQSYQTQTSLLNYTICNTPKGFVCQGVLASAISPIQSIKVSERVYTWYSNSSTWAEAQAICRSNGTYLTVVDTIEEIGVLANFNISFFWTGGRFQNSWIWDHTGQDIETEMLPHRKEGIREEPQNCLIFYRDGSDAKFMNLNCNMRLPFLCEEMGHNSKPQTLRLDFDDEYLVLHNLPLTWDEAHIMCESAGQHLASVTSENVKHFLNLPTVYHDLWLDGKNEDGIWIWTQLNSEVISRNNSSSFLRIAPRPNHDCLILYRQSAHLFSFLDSHCSKKFGFICQGTKYLQKQIKTIIVGGREYSVYSKKATWFQANRICRSNGTYLAVLTTTKEIEQLTQNEVQFEKLWIGAVNVQGTWIWDHTEARVDFNNYTRALYAHEEQCGIIQKLQQGSVAVLPENCTSSYAFVCEEHKWMSKAINNFGHFYSAHSERSTWAHASDMCAENGQYLAVIDTNEEMDIVNQLDIDFHDLWVGAKKIKQSELWVWTHTGQKFSLDEDQNLANKTVANACLNLYREWNSNSTFISRDCNEQHGYICESVPISKEHPRILQAVFSGRKYILIQQQLTWKEAYATCDRFNGYLAIISDQAEADFLSNVDGAFHDLWIGGTKMNDSMWKWHYTGQNITRDVTWEHTEAQVDYDCLNLYAANGKFGTFMDRKCSEKHSFICEETHQYEKIIDTDYLRSKDFDKHEDFVFPPNFLPHYADFRGKQYMFSNVRVDFRSAVNVCRDKSGYLLIVEDQAEKEFIGNNTQGYHSLWIDGKRQNSEWIWEHIGINIPADNFVDYKGHNGHDCLLFYRHNNNISHYVDRKCQEKHSFVCKDVKDGNSETEFTYNNRFYLLIPSIPVTWFEAEEYCRLQGAYLAVVDDTEEARFLSSIGNDLWISGHLENDANTWVWNHTRQQIAFDKYDVLKLTPKTETSENGKCLNIYRNLNNSPLFVERNCNDKFGFVCEDLVALTTGIRNITKQYKGRKYMFVNKKLSWQDAYDTCRKNGSYLAIVSSKEEGDFIAQMANDFHDMWIDGKFVSNSWRNIYTGQNFDTKQSVETAENNSNLTLITWASGKHRPGYDCFSVYLPSSGSLFFVDRNCSELHTFMCEEVINKSTALKTIQYAGVRYTINMNAMSWEEAYQRCRQHGYLAIIDSMEEAVALMKLSGDFHSLWIGAKYNGKKWFWNYTGELINQDYNLWVNTEPQINSNCSILYRDNFLNPFIVDKSCIDTFGYICEEGEISEHFESNKGINYDGKTYTFYDNTATWKEASNYCEITGATLAIVDSIELASLLIEEKERFDFWIDGVLKGLRWQWSSTGSYLQLVNNSAIHYVRIIPRYQQSCLSLFRSNNTVRYLDDACLIKKPFLCQKYDSLLSGNVSVIERNANRYYLTDGLKKTWLEAWKICTANGSYLPIIAEKATADFLASLFSDAQGEAWLGALKAIGRWTWELIDQPLVKDETEMEFPVWTRPHQRDKMCLGLGHQKNKYPVFTDINCSLSRLVICEQGCVALPNVPKVNGSWSRPQCSSRVQRIGEECKINCNPGFLHTGATNIKCTINGWNDYIPICLRVRDFSLNFVSNVKDALNGQKYKATMERKKNVGLLFLIDTSKHMEWEDYETVTEIVKSVVVGVRHPNDTVLSGVILFDIEAHTGLDIEDIDTCSFIQKLDELARKSVSNRTSYINTFKTAQKMMQNASVDGNSVLVLITNSKSTEELDENLFNLKQKGNIIIVIGIKPQVDINLVKQLASPDGSKYHINIEYSALDEVAYILNRTFLYSGKLACCMRLKNTTVFNAHPTLCSTDVSPKDTRCFVWCSGDHHLQGMESLLCTSAGWQSTSELQRPFPECYTTGQVTHKFAKMLKDLYENEVVDSTLYMIDQSNSMVEEDFYNEIKFVKHLLRAGNSKVGAIIFNSEAYVQIPLKNYEDPDYICSLYNLLDSANFSGGHINYDRAFDAASKEIESYAKNCSSCSPQRTLIVMLTDGQGSKTIESAEKLKLQGHIIAVVSVAVTRRRNLINLVSNATDNSPLLFSINSFLDMDDMIRYIDKEFILKDIVYCCKLPPEFQKQYLKMFVMQSEDIQVTCPPGYALSRDNSTLKCTEIGLNPIPTCFAVPKTIAEFIGAQFAHILYEFSRNNKNNYEKQLVIFLVDQTETMTPVKNKQALGFIKSASNFLQLSKNRTAGLINAQNHEAVMLIEPNVSCPEKFSERLDSITFNSTSYSMYKPLKFILENLVTAKANVLTIIISDRLYISTPSLKLASKILTPQNNIYIMEVHTEGTESNIAQLVADRNDMFVSGYYMLKDNIYTIDSFETLEAVAENIYLI